MTNAPITARMREMQRFYVAARSIECLLLAAAAAWLVLSAATLSGSGADSPQASVAALAGAAAAAASWWLSQAHDRASVARRVDARARMQGAVVTAYERETVGDRRPLSRELSKRTAMTLGLGEVRRATLQSRVPLLAVPCVCFALWNMAVEWNARRPAAAGVSALLAGIADDVEDIRAAVIRAESAGTVDARAREALAELLRSACKARDEARAAPERTLQNLRALEQELDRTAASLPPAEDLRRSMSRVSAKLDAALTRLDRDDFAARSPVESDPKSRIELDASRRAAGDTSRRSRAAGAERSSESVASASGSDAGMSAAGAPESAEPSRHAGAGDARAWAREAADAPTAHDAAAADPSSLATGLPPVALVPDVHSPRDELGVTSRIWWGERYDKVVERWVEMRRASRNPSR